MIKHCFQVCFRLMLVSFLLIGLASCRGEQTALPPAIIDQAVMMQAQVNQTSLWQQLALPPDAVPELSVNHIKVERVRPVTVAAEPAYEVVGTYQSKVRYSHRRPIQQSQVPFEVVLQADATNGDWRVLQIGSEVKGDRPWRWQPLKSNPT